MNTGRRKSIKEKCSIYEKGAQRNSINNRRTSKSPKDNSITHNNQKEEVNNQEAKKEKNLKKISRLRAIKEDTDEILRTAVSKDIDFSKENENDKQIDKGSTSAAPEGKIETKIDSDKDIPPQDTIIQIRPENSPAIKLLEDKKMVDDMAKKKKIDDFIKTCLGIINDNK